LTAGNEQFLAGLREFLALALQVIYWREDAPNSYIFPFISKSLGELRYCLGRPSTNYLNFEQLISNFILPIRWSVDDLNVH